MTEYERMHHGLIYDALDKEISEEISRTRQLCMEYNQTEAEESEKRSEILKSILKIDAFEGYCSMESPIIIDNGKELKIGKNFYSNSYFTVIGGCWVEIGDNVFIGPNCTLATGIHSLIADEREIKADEKGTLHDFEYGKPIKIGNNVWLASNVTVCAGVSIGDRSVIGAGSVVTKDIPEGVIAFGNPCRVQREITEKDSIYLRSKRD